MDSKDWVLKNCKFAKGVEAGFWPFSKEKPISDEQWQRAKDMQYDPKLEEGIDVRNELRSNETTLLPQIINNLEAAKMFLNSNGTYDYNTVIDQISAEIRDMQSSSNYFQQPDRKEEKLRNQKGLSQPIPKVVRIPPAA